MKKATIAVLGGDVRMHYAARTLHSLGYTVLEWGREGGTSASNAALFEILERADVWMLPLPATEDGVHLLLRAEGFDAIRLETLLRMANGKQIYGGRLPPAFCELAERMGIFVCDYFDSEALQYRNALPTAEGAIEIAMREIPVTIDGARFAILGYGRIGEVLAQRLVALGAEVCVYARKQSARSKAELLHCTAKVLAEEDDLLGFDPTTRVIFNTVPVRILSRAVLAHLPKECVVIDLASAPGGADPIAAKELGVPLIWATALPGKYAPESAGGYLGQTVDELLRSESLP